MGQLRKKGSVESPREEDYLEAVLNLISDKGYATTSDISKLLGVRPPTASAMTRKLARKGYVEHEPYRVLKLTPAGEKVARSVTKRHRVIEELISMLGVDEATAYVDTEGIEHHVHPVTIRQLEKLALYLKSHSETLDAINRSVEGS